MIDTDNKGVIYYNTGTKCLARLVTSLYSLGKHYRESVAILSEGEESHLYCEPIIDWFNRYNVFWKLTLQKVEFDVPEGPQMTFMKKTLLHKVSPFDVNIFLDSDSLVTGDITPLFDWAEQYEFVGTNFANWVTTGPIMSGRIKNWQKHHPKLIEDAIKFGPALNAGCYAFRNDAEFLKVWYDMTLPGRDINLPEETSMQVILPQFKHYIAPQIYNCSCKHSDPHHPDVRFIHYHRNKHCRVGLPFGADLWVRYFDRINELKIGNPDNYIKFDHTLVKFLKDREGLKLKPVELKIEPTKVESIKVEPKPFIATVVPSNYRREDVTLVSAISPNMLYAFKANFPTWQAKAQFAGLPIIIFHNGFENPEKDLDFVRRVPSARLINWAMETVPGSHRDPPDLRELMISSFVLGAAKYVETDYFLKLDADSYFSGREDVFNESHFRYDLCGHRWGVSKLWMLQKLDRWAESKNIPGSCFLRESEATIDTVPESMRGTKFQHPRIISWICLHRTEFVRDVVAITGDRLPVPSHDTLLWYMAQRLGRPWMGTKLNKGTGHGKRLRQFLDAHKKLFEQGYQVNGYEAT